MSDNKKQVKVEKNKSKFVVAKVEILIYDDGKITVNGPIKNPLMMMDIFGRGLIAVTNYLTREVMENPITIPAQPKIVTLN